MEWFNRVVMGWIQATMQTARTAYQVDPIIFLTIYLVSGPFFYYSIFRMVRALAKKQHGEITIWSMVFLAATAAPFVYVLIFGRNLPWWVYVVIGLLIGQGVFSLVRKLRRKPEPIQRKEPGKGGDTTA